MTHATTRAARKRLHPNFRRAWRARGVTVKAVAAAVGYERFKFGGYFTWRRDVPATPRMVAALSAAAVLIDYRGEIFK